MALTPIQVVWYFGLSESPASDCKLNNRTRLLRFVNAYHWDLPSLRVVRLAGHGRWLQCCRQEGEYPCQSNAPSRREQLKGRRSHSRQSRWGHSRYSIDQIAVSICQVCTRLTSRPSINSSITFFSNALLTTPWSSPPRITICLSLTAAC